MPSPACLRDGSRAFPVGGSHTARARVVVPHDMHVVAITPVLVVALVILWVGGRRRQAGRARYLKRSSSAIVRYGAVAAAIPPPPAPSRIASSIACWWVIGWPRDGQAQWPAVLARVSEPGSAILVLHPVAVMREEIYVDWLAVASCGLEPSALGRGVVVSVWPSPATSVEGVTEKGLVRSAAATCLHGVADEVVAVAEQGRAEAVVVKKNVLASWRAVARAVMKREARRERRARLESEALREEEERLERKEEREARVRCTSAARRIQEVFRGKRARVGMMTEKEGRAMDLRDGLPNSGNDCYRNAVLQALLGCPEWVRRVLEASPYLDKCHSAREELPTTMQVSKFVGSLIPGGEPTDEGKGGHDEEGVGGVEAGGAVMKRWGGTRRGRRRGRGKAKTKGKTKAKGAKAGGAGGGGGGSGGKTGEHDKEGAEELKTASPISELDKLMSQFSNYAETMLGSRPGSQQDAPEFFTFLVKQLGEEFSRVDPKAAGRETRGVLSALRSARRVDRRSEGVKDMRSGSLLQEMFYARVEETTWTRVPDSTVWIPRDPCVGQHYTIMTPLNETQAPSAAEAGQRTEEEDGLGAEGRDMDGLRQPMYTSVREALANWATAARCTTSFRDDYGRQVDCRHTTKFASLPKVLALQAIQFLHEGVTFKRRDTKLSFKASFRVQPSMMSPALCQEYLESGGAEYRLFAVVVHIGETPWSGHYKTFVKGSTNRWRLYNDSVVKDVEEAEVFEPSPDPLETPYLLFFTRV